MVTRHSIYRRNKRLKETDINELKARLGKTMLGDAASIISDISAHKISLDCEELSSQCSRRSSEGTIPAAQLEELTLATYSMFTASALVPSSMCDEHSGNTDEPNGSVGRGKAKPDSRSSCGKLQTPKPGYVNGAIDDADLSDVSI